MASCGRATKSLRKAVNGTWRKLSWLCPNTEPMRLATPTTEGAAAHEDLLAEGIDVGEELVGDVLADEANLRAVLVVGLRKEAAVGNLFLAHVDHAGRDARELRVVDDMALVPHG